MTLLTVLLALALALTLLRPVALGFRAQKPADYANTEPGFSLTKHLGGEIISEGIIYGPTGKVTNSFVAHMVGDWSGDTGTLAENFTYSNGRQQARKWHLSRTSDTTFTASADDIVGRAEGVISGSTIMMRYRITLPKEAGGHTLNVTDWLYLAQNGTILNRSEFRKFGIKVAELVATMRPAKGETASQTQGRLDHADAA